MKRIGMAILELLMLPVLLVGISAMLAWDWLRGDDDDDAR